MMADLPPHSIHSFTLTGSEHDHRYATSLLSNLSNTHPQLRDPHFPPPPHYPTSWRPATLDEFTSWNSSPQGMFPSTLIGPGQNPGPLPHPQPGPPRNTSIAPTRNPGKRKQATPPSGTSSFGGFGPLRSSGETASETSSSSPSPPPRASKCRRNGASDVWAFAHPLASAEEPPPDQWPTSLEPSHTGKPKTTWFGCKLCLGYGIC